jgi:hypothetical protein
LPPPHTQSGDDIDLDERVQQGRRFRHVHRRAVAQVFQELAAQGETGAPDGEAVDGVFPKADLELGRPLV